MISQAVQKLSIFENVHTRQRRRRQRHQRGLKHSQRQKILSLTKNHQYTTERNTWRITLMCGSSDGGRLRTRCGIGAGCCCSPSSNLIYFFTTRSPPSSVFTLIIFARSFQPSAVVKMPVVLSGRETSAMLSIDCPSKNDCRGLTAFGWYQATVRTDMDYLEVFFSFPLRW